MTKPHIIRSGMFLIGVVLIGILIYQIRKNIFNRSHAKEDIWYFAANYGICGRSLLTIGKSANELGTVVYGTGPADPVRVLRAHAQILGKYRIKGHFVEKVPHDVCGTKVAEFYVSELAPDGPVRRCASPYSLAGDLHSYVEGLSTDKYLSVDFVDGEEPAKIDDATCKAAEQNTCPSPLSLITGCDGGMLCCKLSR